MQRLGWKYSMPLRLANAVIFLINVALWVTILIHFLSQNAIKRNKLNLDGYYNEEYDLITRNQFRSRQQRVQTTHSTGLSSYVDPFIGTSGDGHTYPGAALPFGMVQLSPDNGEEGWSWSSGYHFNSSTIVGFSHTHLSGTGMGDLMDVSVMPTIGAVDLVSCLNNPDYRVKFSHSDEIAEPGYYSVLLSNGIQAELTATRRTGMHRYTFPRSAEEKQSIGMVINLSLEFNNDFIIDSMIQLTSLTNTSIQGYRFSSGWASRHRVFFAIELSRPFVHAELQPTENYDKNDKMVRDVYTAAYLSFENSNADEMNSNVVLMKVGISSVSIAGALESIRIENSGWDFDAVRKEAKRQWDLELSKVLIETNDVDKKKIFYTALYHTKLAPNIHSDINGEFIGPDFTIQRISGFNYYSTLSIWDSFRAAHPLLTILDEKRVKDVLRTLYFHAKSMKGILPVWPLAGSETYTMPGYHAVVILADAYKKGLLFNEDIKKFYPFVKLTSTMKEFSLSLMDSLGFVPAEIPKSVTKTLEYSFDDWCSGQLATAIGEDYDANHFYNRSKGYQLLFEPNSKFMRPKFANSLWKEPFNPWYSDHEMGDFEEGTAWQYMFFVPHDIAGLVELHGGKESFEVSIDNLFEAESRIDGKLSSQDISGMIGQYAHGNEPSHHIAYLYNYAGAIHKTQKRVREIMETLYSSEPDGLPGNEDCGQMSAWYVFSSLGFYPVNPAEGHYQLGAPLFDKAVIDVGDGKSFEIQAHGASSKDLKYWSRAWLNGELLNRTYIEHSELMAGGILRFEMKFEP